MIPAVGDRDAAGRPAARNRPCGISDTGGALSNARRDGTAGSTAGYSQPFIDTNTLITVFLRKDVITDRYVVTRAARTV